jgi:hypothetical protein
MKNGLIISFFIFTALLGLFFLKNTALAQGGDVVHADYNNNTCINSAGVGIFDCSGSTYTANGYSGGGRYTTSAGGDSASGLGVGNSFSLATWLKYNSDINGYILHNGEGGDRFGSQYSGGNASAFIVLGGNWYWVNGSKGIQDGNWHRLMYTYDGSHLNQYVDGVFDNSVATTGSYSSDGWRFGSNQGTAQNASIRDNSDAWDYALTSGEVAADFAGTPTISNAVSLQYPVSTSTPINDFSTFYWTGTTTPPTYHLKATITYFNYNHFYIDSHNYDLDESYPSSSQWQYTALYKTHLLTNGQWSAYIYIYDNTTSTSPIFLASSTWNNFEITGGSFLGSSVSTTALGEITSSTQLQITCDPTSNLFSYSICNMMVWLFVPSPDFFNQIGGIYNDIKNKPPFGYFSAAQNAINAINSNATPALTFPDLSGLDYYIFDPIKTGLAWVLWFLFGFWIFKKFRHFQL